MASDDETVAQGCLVSLLLFFPMMAFNAWIICKLWAWIVVPITGLHPVGMIHALALATVFAFMTSDTAKIHYEEKERTLLTKVLMSAATRVAVGFLSLGMGAIWSHFI